MAIMAVAFDPDGRSFWTASWDKTLHRWEVPVAAQGDLERLILETEVLSRMELDPAGQIQVLDGKTWQERRQRLANLNSRE
jgi:WD40 repeat protein